MMATLASTSLDSARRLAVGMSWGGAEENLRADGDYGLQPQVVVRVEELGSVHK
jgi:hypothetical protein